MDNGKDWAYMHTEEYIREKEKKEREWNRENKEKGRVYLEQIEMKLKEGTAQAREELLKMFQNQDFIETYKAKTEMAYLIVIMQIYEREVQNGERRTILDMGDSYEAIRRKLLDLKFILWRIEFAKDVRGEELLLEFIHNNQATPDMIQCIVHTSIVDESKVLVELSDLFIAHNMLRYAFRILEYLDDLEPGNEMVLCILAELCGRVGKCKRAGEYLDKIRNPGIMAERIRKKYGC